MAGNVSSRRPQRFSAPGPLPLRQLVTRRPHRSPPLRRGACWEMECRARRSLEEARPHGDYNSQNAPPTQLLSFSLPQPTVFFLKPNLCLLTAVLGIRAVVYPSRGVPKRRADFRHRESFCWKPP